MPNLTAYLSFDGNCAEAMRFYERTFNGKLVGMLSYGDSPVCKDVPAGNADRIMHAKLDFEGAEIMAGDAMAGQPYEPMKGFNLTLSYPTVAEAERVFNALSDEAKAVIMPFQETFWAERFGMVIDRFGTPWIVNGALKPMEQ